MSRISGGAATVWRGVLARAGRWNEWVRRAVSRPRSLAGVLMSALGGVLVVAILLLAGVGPRIGGGVLLACLLLAGLAGTALLRQGRVVLAELNGGAQGIASKVLPELVKQVRDGRTDGELPALVAPHRRLAPLTEAFETACRQAIEAATEQATMRMGYYSVFVNMFRRSQALLQRQFRLIEQLEKDERSAERLDKLYQIDHLVTRMRRNNENVLILSGTELVRKAAKPIPLSSVIQAALSEIDQYQRVEVLDTPTAKIIDAAASDLIRMLAELLDNATAFSAPNTKVLVEAQVLRDGSVTIAALDKGIGMSDEQIAEANERLTRLSSAELARSRRVGLLVVGRLAGRQGMAVQLVGGSDRAGVTALVSVPAALVVEAERPGWADRRHAMNAAAARRRVAAARQLEQRPPDLVKTAARRPAPSPARIAPKPLPQPVRTVPARGVAQAVRTLDENLVKELVEQAHANVPDELPTRTPNRLIGKTGTRARAEPVAPGWFQAKGAKPVPRIVPVGKGKPENWWSAADKGWRRVDSVVEPGKITYALTEDGLPQRQPGAHLLPGSARPVDGGPPKQPRPVERDSDRVRDRLSSFQQALGRAKGDQEQPPRQGWRAMGEKR